MSTSRSVVRHVWWSILGVLVAAVAAALLPLSRTTAARSGTDARITFYEARLGGRATYPAHARLGVAYLQKFRDTGQLGYLRQARQHLETSQRHQPNFEALLGLAAVSLADHRFRDASTYARQAVTAFAGHPEAEGLLFDATLAVGNYDEAGTLAAALARRGTSLATLARVASLREVRGDLDGAVAAMELACSESGDLPDGVAAWCHVRLGAMYLSRCERERAAREYDRALDRFPAFPLAREHKAEMVAAEGRVDAALSMYEQLLEETEDPKYRVALADLHQLAGRTASATTERQQAIADLRKLYASGSYAQLPVLVTALADVPDAVPEALRLARTDWEHRKDFLAAEQLAWALWKAGSATEALTFIDAALEPGARSPALLMRAGIIYAGVGAHRRGRELLEQALSCPAAMWPPERLEAERALSRVTAR